MVPPADFSSHTMGRTLSAVATASEIQTVQTGFHGSLIVVYRCCLGRPGPEYIGDTALELRKKEVLIEISCYSK